MNFDDSGLQFPGNSPTSLLTSFFDAVACMHTDDTTACLAPVVAEEKRALASNSKTNDACPLVFDLLPVRGS